MNRTIYLAGPMEHVSEEDAQGWRQTATDILTPYGVNILSPVRRIHNFRKEEMKSIFELDLRDIKECDLILVNLNNPEIPKHGTAIEVFYCSYVLQKSVVAFKENADKIHPFFESLVTEWRSTVEKACDTIISKYL
jgi:nucleoside 2-deoxyribosyltransferase